MTYILAIDPGGTTGWAYVKLQDRKCVLLQFGKTKDPMLKELHPYLDESDYFVVEDFQVRPNKAREGAFDWDRMETPKVIGAAEMLADLKGVPLVLQPPSIKPVGYGFAGMKYRKGARGKHTEDAIAHAAYFAVRQLKALPGMSR